MADFHGAHGLVVGGKGQKDLQCLLNGLVVGGSLGRIFRFTFRLRHWLSPFLALRGFERPMQAGTNPLSATVNRQRRAIEKRISNDKVSFALLQGFFSLNTYSLSSCVKPIKLSTFLHHFAVPCSIFDIQSRWRLWESTPPRHPLGRMRSAKIPRRSRSTPNSIPSGR